MIGRPLSDRAAARSFMSNDKFRSSLNKILQGRAKRRNVPGQDGAVGLGQAIASVKGRNNTRRTKPMGVVNPVSAAMQHSVRNRSIEQGANRSPMVSSIAAAINDDSTVRKQRATAPTGLF